MLDRAYPPDFPHERFLSLRLKGFSFRDSNAFGEAENCFREQLQILLDSQTRLKRSVNKGGILYDLGVSLALRGMNHDAVFCLLEAYVEDALTTDNNKEDEAKRAAAYNILMDYYGVKTNIISAIDNVVLEKKSKEMDVLDPHSILEDVMKQLGLDLDDLSQWVRDPRIKLLNKSYFGFPEQWEHRIFVGGAYKSPESMRILYTIKDAVRRKDCRFVPIIGSDVFMKKEDIHHHTLLLLHTCKWAIFDVTYPAGQFMEIERTLDYENRVLVMYQKNKEDSDAISQMIQTYSNPRIHFEKYIDEEEMRQKISNFLPKFEDASYS